MIYTKNFLIAILITFSVFSYSNFSFAANDPGTQSGLVPCENELITTDVTLADGTKAKVSRGDCDYVAFIELIKNVINFIFIYLAIPIAAIMFVYAGVLLVTSAGNEGNRTKAKSIFFDTVVGLVIAAAAWLIIRTLLSISNYKWILDVFNK